MGPWGSHYHGRSIKQAPGQGNQDFESRVSQRWKVFQVRADTEDFSSSIIRSKHSRPGLEFQAEMHPKTSRKQATSFNHEISTSDSSAEEDVEEGSVAPEPDAGISYSFDAPHGPTEGRTILGMAFAEAVEKFETKELEKLVKDEYEVIVKEQDKFHLTEPAADADADGFELI